MSPAAGYLLSFRCVALFYFRIKGIKAKSILFIFHCSLFIFHCSWNYKKHKSATQVKPHNELLPGI